MNNVGLHRREFMRSTTIGSLALPGLIDSVFGGTTESKIENRKSKSPGLPPIRAITQGSKFHWFSYYDKLQFDPTGRFAIGMEVDFEHRWRATGLSCFGTRMLTDNSDGTDINIVDPYGKTSHFIWRDPGHILAWAWHPSHGDAFYLYEDGTDKVEIAGKGIMTRNGHCTYLPGNKWILNDAYPDSERKQNVYLYNVATGKTVPLGHFYLPPEYKGEWRCDTYPRFSPDGQSVVIDSSHAGNSRQMYLIDISTIVG